MTNTPETDELRDDIWATSYVEGSDFAQMFEHARKLERERDEAIRSCHIWQKGHAELVAERDYLISLLEGQQFFADTKSTKPERKHIGRWGHNRQEFTSPYINNSKQ